MKAHEKDEFELYNAVRSHDKTKVERLLKEGADVNAQDNEYGLAPLHGANDHKIAALLIKAGANVNAIDKQGSTSLHFAALHNNKKIAALLIKAGANVDVEDVDGCTPLDIAKQRQNTEAISVLQEFDPHYRFRNQVVETSHSSRTGIVER